MKITGGLFYKGNGVVRQYKNARDMKQFMALIHGTSLLGVADGIVTKNPKEFMGFLTSTVMSFISFADNYIIQKTLSKDFKEIVLRAKKIYKK